MNCEVHLHSNGRSLLVYPRSEDFDPNIMMGWRHQRGRPYYVAENNMVNRIVLGLPYNPAYKVDEVDDARLHAYQKLDVQKMCSLRECLNANPMGLGKTPETVVALRRKNAKNILVVCPKIVRDQWVAQLKNWGDYDAKVYTSQKAVPKGVWVVNYERLRGEKTRMKFKTFQWDAVVLDEAHKIKNRNSTQTKAMKDLPAKIRIALTGTPILRYVDDLWSILHFLNPYYSGSSYWDFVSYFCNIQKTPWGNKIIGLTEDKQRVAVLNTLMDTIAIRNSAVEVAHGRTSERVLLPMSKEQRELYRKEKQLLLDELPENLTIANGAVLTLRLMQATSWPGQFLEKVDGPKFEWVLETCRNNPEEKLVVFSVFGKTVIALTHYLNNNGIRAVCVHGGMKDTDKEYSATEFKSGLAQVIIGTIGAMGTGYDGLQKVSRLMVFLDRDWSPEIMAQAEARLDRMGQESPVHVCYLECQGSFDQYVGKINQTKAKDIREALNDGV